MLGEYYRDAQGLSLINARLSNVYGPGDRTLSRLVPATIHKLLNGERPVINCGEFGAGALRDYIYIDDCVEALVLLGERLLSGDEEGYDCMVASGSHTSVRNVVSLLCKLTQSDLSPVYTDTRVTEAFHRIGSYASLRSMGWKPNIPLEEGLKRTVDWFKENR